VRHIQEITQDVFFYITKMNPSIYDMEPTAEEIVKILDEKKTVILHGPGGTGKTTKIKKVHEILIGEGKKVMVAATTGVAAVNVSSSGIPTRTLHSALGIPLHGEYVMRYRDRKIADMDVLIVDEFSMMGKKMFEMINFILQSQRNSDLPLGGVKAIFIGDLYQHVPVNDDFVFRSKMFCDLEPHIVEMTVGYRFVPDWFQQLLRFRVGNVTDEDYVFLRSKIIAAGTIPDDEYLRVFAKNADCDAYNARKMKLLEGTPSTYSCTDYRIPIASCATYRQFSAILSRIDQFKIPNDKTMDDVILPRVELKVGARVILRYNIDVGGGLVNGRQGTVISMHDDNVKIRTADDIVHSIPFVYFLRYKAKDVTVRRQIPLMLAFAMTGHKVQGMTLDKLFCSLKVFGPNQAYVMLSRLRDPKYLLIAEDFQKTAIYCDASIAEYLEKK
jgi:ATP-dependent DNA helicase PIF1